MISLDDSPDAVDSKPKNVCHVRLVYLLVDYR